MDKMKSNNQHTLTTSNQTTSVAHSEIQRRDIVGELNSGALRYMRNKHSKNTQEAYKSDARIFSEWSFIKGIDPLHATAAEIASFLADQADGELNRWIWTDKTNKKGYLQDGEGLSYSTIYRRLNGIKFALTQLGRTFQEAELSVFSDVLQGIAETNGTEKDKVTGLTPDDLKVIFKHFNTDDVIDLRDRALITLLFAGAFRRSELANLEYNCITIYPGKGMEITLKKAKRKKSGITKVILVGGTLCPVRFLQEYLAIANITEGSVFRGGSNNRKITRKTISGQTIGNIVKKRCEDAGLKGRYGGHSGRHGFVDTSLKHNKPINSVMKMTGHVSLSSLQEYFSVAEQWSDNAGAGLLND